MNVILFDKSGCSLNILRLLQGKSRTESHRKTKIGTGVAHITCD